MTPSRPATPTQLASPPNDHGQHLVLVVDDIRDNVTIMVAHLKARGYRTLAAYGGADAIHQAQTLAPDLIMLDINMPQVSGLDVCVQLKARPETAAIPIILVTAHAETSNIVRGFEVGADDYLIKPFNYVELLARVRSMLRIRDTTASLLAANQAMDELNRNLEAKVQQQVGELERVNRLRRFFSPQLVNTIVSENSDDVLNEHRREITVVFLDLRNFTSFAETASPQEVIRTIRDLHSTVGPIIFRYRGTLERFTGDGLMVFLGDPEPMLDHAVQAVNMAKEIRAEMEQVGGQWLARGYDLKLGMGAATGEASLGTIGFEGRLDYAAIGSVTNLAARLCGRADGGQILIAESTNQQLGDAVATRPYAEIALKGFSKPHRVFEVV